mgnify:CR=1 FL=1
MKDRITIHMYDRLRAFYLADFLSTYGIDVEEVVIFEKKCCMIIMWGDETEIMNLVYQFHEDY